MIKETLNLLDILGTGLKMTDYAPGYGSAAYNLLEAVFASSAVAAQPTPADKIEETAKQVALASMNTEPFVYHASDSLRDFMLAGNTLYKKGVKLSTQPNAINAIDFLIFTRTAAMYTESGLDHLGKAAQSFAH